MRSVHDNIAYGYSVDCECQRLSVHTVYLHQEPEEFTDIVFTGVQAHRLQYALLDNVLFDVVEVEPDYIVDNESELLRHSWKYGWPGIEYGGDLSLLKAVLLEERIKGFEIESSNGLTGWVLASACEMVGRDSRASIG